MDFFFFSFSITSHIQPIRKLCHFYLQYKSHIRDLLIIFKDKTLDHITVSWQHHFTTSQIVAFPLSYPIHHAYSIHSSNNMQVRFLMASKLYFEQDPKPLQWPIKPMWSGPSLPLWPDPIQSSHLFQFLTFWSFLPPIPWTWLMYCHVRAFELSGPFRIVM